MKVAAYIAHALKNKGIDTVFELQGGMITRLIDAMHREGGIKIVSMHHEQAAAMAADAYGRISRKPGVALATSGPGATNLLTGIGNCYFDSVPAIFITGQVNLNEQKGDRPTRQIGFQETDIVSMARPVTKAAFAVKTANEIPCLFEEAYHIALSGRPGPVLIDIPMNIQNEEVELPALFKTHDRVVAAVSATHDLFIHKYIGALRSSKRPLVLVGRGLRSSGTVETLRRILHQCQLPVVTSLLGFDVLPYDHPLRVGFIGTYGNRWSNYALGSCDLLLVLGSRLDLRQTGADTASFQHGKVIYHVDIDSAELNNRVTGCEALWADLADFMPCLEANVPNYRAPVEWVNVIREKRQAHLDVNELKEIAGINPNVFMHQLSRASQKAEVFTADVGNNQMWSAQSLELAAHQQFLTSGGMGAMGYSLPAAIGASILMGNLPVVAVIGDGGMQINIQELQTIRRNNLPIKIVILNNHCLGMIRQFQDSFFGSCYQSTVWGYTAPSFSQIALAYGIESRSISTPEEIQPGVAKLWEKTNQPYLLEVSLDVHTNVYPKMMFGSPITKMEPEE